MPGGRSASSLAAVCGLIVIALIHGNATAQPNLQTAAATARLPWAKHLWGYLRAPFHLFSKSWASDGALDVEWAANQSWSWPGLAQLFTASVRPRHLDAMAPGMAGRHSSSLVVGQLSGHQSPGREPACDRLVGEPCRHNPIKVARDPHDLPRGW